MTDDAAEAGNTAGAARHGDAGGSSGRIALPTPRQRQQKLWRVRGLHVKNTVGTLGDWELVARIKDPDVKLQVEMNRRLKDTTKANTAELVSFRKSADAAARRSEDAAARAGASAARLERLTRWLIAFTVGLVVLTVAVVALTAVLAARG